MQASGQRGMTQHQQQGEQHRHPFRQMLLQWQMLLS
jgi:hypothetical protein